MKTLTRLVLATHNKGKVAEIQELLNPWGIEVLCASDLDLPVPEETGMSFVENAVLKARLAAQVSGFPALADDSGLAVNALDGQPGIYSARWAGPEKDFPAAMQKIHDALGSVPDRSAAFICALALAWPDGACETFEGRVEGTLVWPPRGENGFGYDPIFAPEDGNRTFGEMSAEGKQKISHRARAFQKLVGALSFPLSPGQGETGKA